MTYATYEDLLDAARKHDGIAGGEMWQTITQVVHERTTRQYKATHNGRWNSKGVDTLEPLVARDILRGAALAYTAWGVAQTLRASK